MRFLMSNVDIMPLWVKVEPSGHFRKLLYLSAVFKTSWIKMKTNLYLSSTFQKQSYKVLLQEKHIVITAKPRAYNMKWKIITTTINHLC